MHWSRAFEHTSRYTESFGVAFQSMKTAHQIADMFLGSMFLGYNYTESLTLDIIPVTSSPSFHIPSLRHGKPI